MSFYFSHDGRKRFADVTRQNIGKHLAIIIDGQAYCAPKIMTEFPGGKAEISGSVTKQEARGLAKKIARNVKH